MFRKYARKLRRSGAWEPDHANSFLVINRVLWQLRMRGDKCVITLNGFSRFYAEMLANEHPRYARLFAIVTPIPMSNAHRAIVRRLREGSADTDEMNETGGTRYSVRLSELKWAGFEIIAKPDRNGDKWRYRLLREPEWSERESWQPLPKRTKS